MTRNIDAKKAQGECLGGNFMEGVSRFDESPVHSVYSIVRGCGRASITRLQILGESPWGERATLESLEILLKSGMVVRLEDGGFRAFACHADGGGEEVTVRRYPEMVPCDDDGEE